MVKPKLNKTEQKEAAKYETQMRREVSKLQAVDGMTGSSRNAMNDALEEARSRFKLLKESRGEDYDKDMFKEIKLPPGEVKKNGNR
jgi:hypothetical protein